MKFFNKYGTAFAFALTLHLAIIGMFGFSFVEQDSERVKQQPTPEIIQASMLDDEKILEEVNRIKEKELSKQRQVKKQQQELVQKRQKEQEMLEKARQKRQAEEQKARELEQKARDQEKKRQADTEKEQQRLAQLKQEKEQELARLEKIRNQQEAEKKRLEAIRKAEEKKQELARIAEQKKQQALLEKQKAEAAAKAALLKKQAQKAKAKALRDQQAVSSATRAIQSKVNSHWIKPLSAKKGLNCTIRVKLLPSGDVMDASVIRSSGDPIFDRSAENAVRKASPLPVPKDKTLFSKKFRSFTFEFKPQ